MIKKNYSFDEVKTLFSPIIDDFKPICQFDGNESFSITFKGEPKNCCEAKIILTLEIKLDELKNKIEERRKDKSVSSLNPSHLSEDIERCFLDVKDYLSPFNGGENDYYGIADFYIKLRGSQTGKNFGL